MSKPVLLLDMDGPLADFDLAFYNYCRDMGYELNIEGLTDPNRRRFMTDNMPNRAARDSARHYVDSTRWFLQLPVTAGASEGVPLLMEHFDVWVCSKPLEANLSCRDDKYLWLTVHFPELAARLILAPKKGLVHGDILLDDAIALDCIEQATWKPVVFDDTFNGVGSKWEGLPRWTWNRDIDLLLEML